MDKAFELCLSMSMGRGMEIFKKLQHHFSSSKAMAPMLLHLQASISPPGKDEVPDSSLVCSKDTLRHFSKGQDNWPVPRFNGFITAGLHSWKFPGLFPSRKHSQGTHGYMKKLGMEKHQSLPATTSPVHRRSNILGRAERTRCT